MISQGNRIYTSKGFYDVYDLVNNEEIKKKADKLYTLKGWTFLHSLNSENNKKTIKLYFSSGHTLETTPEQNIVTISRQLVPVQIPVSMLNIGASVSLFAPEIIHNDLIYINDAFNMFKGIIDYDLLNEPILYRLNFVLGTIFESIIRNKAPIIKCKNEKELNFIFDMCISLMIAVSKKNNLIYIHSNSLLPIFIMIKKITGYDIPINNMTPVFNFLSDQIDYLNSITKNYNIHFNYNENNLFNIRQSILKWNEELSKKILNLCAWSQVFITKKEEKLNNCVDIKSDLNEYYVNGFLLSS